jgi:hypothetical protein
MNPLLAFATFAAALGLSTNDKPQTSWEGPGKFCAYAAIIELSDTENITAHMVGIHSARFTWQGSFGELDVRAIGWASEPKGRLAVQKTSLGHMMFAERRVEQGYEVAIWNGDHGAVYFRSPKRFTADQMNVIDQVDLFDEAKPKPEGCKYRMLFAWD